MQEGVLVESLFVVIVANFPLLELLTCQFVPHDAAPARLSIRQIADPLVLIGPAGEALPSDDVFHCALHLLEGGEVDFAVH